MFRRTAIGVNNADASAADDRKIVAALDTQYQAAVKENDTAAMGRILADDFALVTGGWHYTLDPSCCIKLGASFAIPGCSNERYRRPPLPDRDTPV